MTKDTKPASKRKRQLSTSDVAIAERIHNRKLHGVERQIMHVDSRSGMDSLIGWITGRLGYPHHEVGRIAKYFGQQIDGNVHKVGCTFFTH